MIYKNAIELRKFIREQDEFDIYREYLDKQADGKRRKICLISKNNLEDCDFELKGTNLFNYGSKLELKSERAKTILNSAREIVKKAKKLYDDKFIDVTLATGPICTFNFDVLVKEE